MFAPCLLALLAGAQRAPGFLVVLHRIPAHAQARSGQEQRGTSVVGRSGHGRPLYAGRLTFHPRRAARLAHGRRPAAQRDSQPEVLDLLAHQFGDSPPLVLVSHHLDNVFVAEPDDELAVVDPLFPASPAGGLVEVSAGEDQGRTARCRGGSGSWPPADLVLAGSPAQDSRSAAARSNLWAGTSSPQTPSSPR